MLYDGCDFDPLELEKGWSIPDKGSSTSLSRVSPTLKMTFSKGRWRFSEHLLISIWVGNNKLHHDEGYLPPSGAMFPPIRLPLSAESGLITGNCLFRTYEQCFIWWSADRVADGGENTHGTGHGTHQIQGASRCCFAENEQELHHKQHVQRTNIKMLLRLLTWQCSPVKTKMSTQQFY